MNRKGQISGNYSPIMSMFRFSIVVFITVLFFGGLIYVFGLLNDQFTIIGQNYERTSGGTIGANFTYAAQSTFGKVNESMVGLRNLAVVIIFSEIMFIFIVNAFLRIHPMFFIIWILVVILAVIFAAPISNAYESILNTGIYNHGLESFVGANWVLANLPTFVLIVGAIGGVFMFINIVRAGNEEILT